MWTPSGSGDDGSRQVPRLGREGGLLASPVGTRREPVAPFAPLKLLLVSNDTGLVRLLRSMLPEGPKGRIQMQTCDRLTGALARLRYQPFDVVVLDLVLPDCRGIPSIQILSRSFPEMPVVVLTESPGEVTGQEALEAGAQDYLQKGLMDAEVLVRTLRFAVHRQRTASALKDSEEGLRGLVENLPDGVVLYNRHGITFANSAAMELFGVSSLMEVRGREVTEFLRCPQDPDLGKRLGRIATGGYPRRLYQEAQCAGGGGRGEAVCQVIAAPLPQSREAQGQLVLREISYRKRAEQYQRLASSVLEAAPGAMMVLDAGGRVEGVNRAFLAMTGYGEREVLGRDSRFLGVAGQGTELFPGVARTLRHQDRWRGEFWVLEKDGGGFVTPLTVTAIRNDQGQVTHYVGAFGGAEGREAVAPPPRHPVRHDPETGLPNLGLLHDRIVRALADRHREPPGRDRVALLLVGLERGGRAPVGKAPEKHLWPEVARRAREALRSGDTVARAGEWELAVLLENLPGPERAEDLARRLIRRLTRPLPHQDEETAPKLRARVGIALAPEHGEQAHHLLHRADEARDAARGSGARCYALF
ncbi:MAG: PAS domain S-box protein [Thiohalorhabdus sp.]|uniref:PAS domain S-box protein n=1 Tax=Thiohalorhabdus sp. TaxID=3094134 RepID=UPI00398188B2